MLWAYDDAIVKDLTNCIDPTGTANNTVKMMGEDGMMGILAQLQEDKITFPAVFLNRSSDTPLDSKRFNFTRLHKGVPAVYDPERNDIYYEKCAPIELSYELHVLATNTADLDEFTREIVFRYSNMYFITMQIPYESKRNIQFGIAINPDAQITRKSGNSDYIEGGRLFESILSLQCEGAVLLSYTPRHMRGMLIDPKIVIRNPV